MKLHFIFFQLLVIFKAYILNSIETPFNAKYCLCLCNYASILHPKRMENPTYFPAPNLTFALVLEVVFVPFISHNLTFNFQIIYMHAC